MKTTATTATTTTTAISIHGISDGAKDRHPATTTLAATDLAQDVEEEGVDVVVQSLVVEEQLGQRAQVLPVLLLLASVHFEHRQISVPVNLLRSDVRAEVEVRENT